MNSCKAKKSICCFFFCQSPQPPPPSSNLPARNFCNFETCKDLLIASKHSCSFTFMCKASTLLNTNHLFAINVSATASYRDISPLRLSKCSGRPCCAYMLCVSTLEDGFLGRAPVHVSGAGVQEAAAIHCG